MSYTVNSPKQDLVTYLFLRALAADGIREAEVAPVHSTFRVLAKSLRELKTRNPALYVIRFNFEPGDAKFDELDRAVTSLKDKEVLDVVREECEKIRFFPDESHRDRHTVKLLDEEVRLIGERSDGYKFRPSDCAMLTDLCRQAVGVYKSLRKPSCD